MDNLLAARSQMALSLGFHIIFACIGMAMPFFMAASHWKYLKTGDSNYRILTKAWSRGVAIFFAVGAVSGTALSFELGLLWPGFMDRAGPIIGMAFSWEGTAFFLEAVALGIFLYGWDRVHPWVHWASGLVVGIAGLASAFFVICANAWMNVPHGFDWNGGAPINIDPWAAMFTKTAVLQGGHMILAAFQAVGFAVAGLHAVLWIRNRHLLHQKAMKIAFLFAAFSSLLQPFAGDLISKNVARTQPIKLAAMESLFETQKNAPLILGGIPNLERKTTEYGLEIPGVLSFFAYGDFNAEVKGLDAFPQENWPPVKTVHLAFQTMVGIGSLLALVSVFGLFSLRKRKQFSLNMARILTFCIPLGFIAIEAGWIVTEVGRQPWIIFDLLKTSDALTTRPGIAFSFFLYLILYLSLAFVVAVLLFRQIQQLHRELGIPDDEPFSKGGPTGTAGVNPLFTPIAAPNGPLQEGAAI